MIEYNKTFTVTQVYQSNILINKDVFVTLGLAKPVIIESIIFKTLTDGCDAQGGVFL